MRVVRKYVCMGNYIKYKKIIRKETFMAKLMHSKNLNLKVFTKKESFDHLRDLNIFIILSHFGYNCNFEGVKKETFLYLICKVLLKQRNRCSSILMNLL